jgi:hypothetical protein
MAEESFKPGTPGLVPPTTPTTQVESEVVGERKKKKKKKKFSSKSYKRIEKMDEGMSKAGRRVARAVARGVRNWEKHRDRSSRKKKNGAFVKVIENSAQAFGTFVREASNAPRDMTKGQKIFRMMMPFSRK